MPENFEFEIQVPSGSKLVRINIDGSIIEGDELAHLASDAEDRVVTGGKFVPLVNDKIFLVIDAVGEPTIELKLLSLKFQGEDVFDEEKTFVIDDNRRASLEIENINLP